MKTSKTYRKSKRMIEEKTGLSYKSNYEYFIELMFHMRIGGKKEAQSYLEEISCILDYKTGHASD